jgi:hypothetical protein
MTAGDRIYFVKKTLRRIYFLQKSVIKYILCSMSGIFLLLTNGKYCTLLFSTRTKEYTANIRFKSPDVELTFVLLLLTEIRTKMDLI